VASALSLFRQGVVGFIDWLDEAGRSTGAVAALDAAVALEWLWAWRLASELE